MAMSIMERNPYSFIAHAVFPGIGPDIVKSILLCEARQQGLPIIEENGCVGCRTDLGEILLCATSDGLKMTVTAATSDSLQLLCDEIGEHLLEVAPEVSHVLRWKTAEEAGAPPQGFRLCKVVSVTPLGSAFLRVRLSGHDLEPFARDAIHFRLIQPPLSGRLAWPSIDRNGRTVWPTGPFERFAAVRRNREFHHQPNHRIVLKSLRQSPTLNEPGGGGLCLHQEFLRGDSVGVEGGDLRHEVVLLLAGIAGRRIVDDIGVVAEVVRIAH